MNTVELTDIATALACDLPDHRFNLGGISDALINHLVDNGYAVPADEIIDSIASEVLGKVAS